MGALRPAQQVCQTYALAFAQMAADFILKGTTLAGAAQLHGSLQTAVEGTELQPAMVVKAQASGEAEDVTQETPQAEMRPGGDGSAEASANHDEDVFGQLGQQEQQGMGSEAARGALVQGKPFLALTQAGFSPLPRWS